MIIGKRRRSPMKTGLKRFLSSILALALIISCVCTDTGLAFAAQSRTVTSKKVVKQMKLRFILKVHGMVLIFFIGM